MGYRSNVGIMCEPGAYYLFKEAWEKNGGLRPNNILFDGANLYMLKWDDVKWYTGYDEIKVFEDVMCRLNSPEESDPWCGDAESYRYKYIRIGDDDDDIEWQENDDLEFYVVRDFDYNSSAFKEVE